MSAEKIYVFDACAVIALLDEEPGAEVVEALLEEDENRFLIHIVNVCEIYYDLYRRSGVERADKLESVLESYGIELNDSLSTAIWRKASRLKAEWKRVSLADCFALALSVLEDGILVTSDHHELDRIAQAEICSFQFIR